ncbi:MAG: hypothetical protein ACOC58_01355, partial [Chloroflexota bacterium]
PIVCSRLQLYLDRLRYVRPRLDGKDLKNLGVRPGPDVGKLLQRLLEAKLDERTSTREEEESLVHKWLQQDYGETIG